MQKDNFTLDSRYKGSMLVECLVDKYKKTGSFSMLGGNKQKKWLILDLAKKEFRYQPDKEAANKAKSIPFSTVQILRVDLSKAGKYYIDMVTKDRPYRFKFPNIDSWIVFTEALRHVMTPDGSHLFISTEAYLTTCIKYHEQYDGVQPKTAIDSPEPLPTQQPRVDLADTHHDAPKTKDIKSNEQGKTVQFDLKTANPTPQPSEVRKVAVKEKKMKLDSDSEPEEDQDKQHNEIVKKRKNV